MTATSDSLLAVLLPEILRDGHRYASGIDHRRPVLVSGEGVLPTARGRRWRERGRDLLERGAAAAGFSHRHFDPDLAGERLGRIVELADGLQGTYERLADVTSRRALVDVLKWRVLGPFHAPLRITPEQYRARQARVDAQLKERDATFDVTDPWFTPLSLYRPSVRGGGRVRLHSHSVDIVSVYEFDQYTYSVDDVTVGARRGDVVLDVGGCWGDTALYFATLGGPECAVRTFEFSSENLRIMRENLALNPDLTERIEVVEQALWDRSGEKLDFADAGRMTTLRTGSTAAGAVETLTLDDHVAQTGLPRVDLVKMDVEGAELRILAGAVETLRSFRPRLAIAAYHCDDDLIRLPEFISDLGVGYRLYLKSSSPLEDETILFATVD